MYWYKLEVASANQTELPTECSKQFYHTAGTLIIQVANVLYSIPSAGPFIAHSSVLKDMTQMAHGPVVKEEGSSDLIPIWFGDPFSVEKMDHLLGWIYREKLDRELNVKELADILELGTFLDMHCARVTAIEQLSRISNFPPALKLSLALSFHVSEWIEPALWQLLKTDAGSLTYVCYTSLPFFTCLSPIPPCSSDWVSFTWPGVLSLPKQMVK
ncbi:hypothetical protein M422DRAFT_272129 [Sphaerobolus stellatus SS14]|uniref:BTB domain-containing protein n=1 Tax=Sphaerobolus stellatus (strain SS14) TaxID=990650 RepID=A0A0C9UMT4_SPHS4|nr:hypothetical protein M422DRAFT_272129 [Sphaerobolus stellatus SS14]